MGHEATGESPLSAAAEAAGVSVADAFALLGNETRLAILLALWEAYAPYGDTDGIPFSELRARVGVADSGQFNYHLGKLDGEFVRKGADGYVLTPVGLQLVQTVVAGVGQDAAFQTHPLDVPCHRCGGATELVYRHGWLYHRCTNCPGELGGNGSPHGALFGEPFPASALANRTPSEVFTAAVFRLLAVTALKIGGVCPRCSAVVDATLQVCDDHDATAGSMCTVCGNATALRSYWLCSVCKDAGSGSPASAAISHPAVVAFYHDHGVEVGYPLDDLDAASAVLELMRSHEQALVSSDPPMVRVTVRYDGDELVLTFDDRLRLVEQPTPT